MVDRPDLKSVGACPRVGSSPTARTKTSRNFNKLSEDWRLEWPAIACSRATGCLGARTKLGLVQSHDRHALQQVKIRQAAHSADPTCPDCPVLSRNVRTLGKWRKRWDSNPRNPWRFNWFRVSPVMTTSIRFHIYLKHQLSEISLIKERIDVENNSINFITPTCQTNS